MILNTLQYKYVQGRDLSKWALSAEIFLDVLPEPLTLGKEVIPVRVPLMTQYSSAGGAFLAS